MTGPELRAMRKAAGLTGDQCAHLLGTVRETIYRYERGNRAIPATFAKLAAILLPAAAAQRKGGDHE